MRKTINLLAFLFAAASVAHAQVAPAATVGVAHFSYNFNYAQTAEFGGTLGNWQTISPSASVDYANSAERLPFDLRYTGGYTATVSGPAYSTGLFQRLLLSQGFVGRKWKVTVSDDVSYRPQAPTTGFSGIPGIGEPIGSPTPPSSQSILTLRTHVVDNTVNGSVGDNLNYATTLTFGGSSDLLRYPDGNGLSLNGQTANAGLVWRLNGRNSFSANYAFSQFSYPDYSFSFVTSTVLFGFTRDWSRKLSTDVSVGPQLTSSSQSTSLPSSTGTGIPSATGVSVRAVASYQFKFVTAALNYTHGVNGGSGYLFGAKSDDVIGTFSREFGRNLTIGFNGAYTRTTALANNTLIGTEFGGTQVSRRFGRHINVFANYTARDQSSNSSLQANVINSLLQTISFGVGYSPKKTEFIGQ